MTINIFNRDCMDAMKEMNDNAFDLAIVDPPYGIGINGDMAMCNTKSNDWSNPHGNNYKIKNWDNSPPPREYFDELRRVSRFQIIWGGNYFTNMISPSGGWIVWNKGVTMPTLSKGELAWTNRKNSVDIVDILWSGYRRIDNENRIHPTQKPVRLYEWILEKYAKPNWKILDTHIGSGSIAIACHDLGFDLTGYEIDSDYYNDCMKRLNEHQRQLKLFG